MPGPYTEAQKRDGVAPQWVITFKTGGNWKLDGNGDFVLINGGPLKLIEHKKHGRGENWAKCTFGIIDGSGLAGSGESIANYGAQVTQADPEAAPLGAAISFFGGLLAVAGLATTAFACA